MLEKTRIGRKICERRKECGISIVELADKIGVGCGVVSNWENGVEMPDITYLQPLADTLDVTIDYIIRDNCFSKDVFISMKCILNLHLSFYFKCYQVNEI